MPSSRLQVAASRFHGAGTTTGCCSWRGILRWGQYRRRGDVRRRVPAAAGDRLLKGYGEAKPPVLFHCKLAAGRQGAARHVLSGDAATAAAPGQAATRLWPKGTRPRKAVRAAYPPDRETRRPNLSTSFVSTATFLPPFPAPFLPRLFAYSLPCQLLCRLLLAFLTALLPLPCRLPASLRCPRLLLPHLLVAHLPVPSHTALKASCPQNNYAPKVLCLQSVLRPQYFALK